MFPVQFSKLPLFFTKALTLQSQGIPNKINGVVKPEARLESWGWQTSTFVSQVHPASTASTAYEIGTSERDFQRLVLAVEVSRTGAVVSTQQFSIQALDNTAERILYLSIATTGLLTHMDIFDEVDKYVYIPPSYKFIWTAPTTGVGEVLTLEAIILRFPFGLKVR